ncbi:hypothetical protein EV363DRAFT_1398920 [Boletus edulis]|nr:hypothetical protein EV363DRAFT_1398920 [Boletus edulis]
MSYITLSTLLIASHWHYYPQKPILNQFRAQLISKLRYQYHQLMHDRVTPLIGGDQLLFEKSNALTSGPVAAPSEPLLADPVVHGWPLTRCDPVTLVTTMDEPAGAQLPPDASTHYNWNEPGKLSQASAVACDCLCPWASKSGASFGGLHGSSMLSQYVILITADLSTVTDVIQALPLMSNQAITEGDKDGDGQLTSRDPPKTTQTCLWPWHHDRNIPDCPPTPLPPDEGKHADDGTASFHDTFNPYCSDLTLPLASPCAGNDDEDLEDKVADYDAQLEEEF